MFLLRPFLLFAALSHVAVGLRISISDDSNPSTTGSPRPVSMEGLSSAPECSFDENNEEFLIRLNDIDIAYDVAETEPHSWYGKERIDGSDAGEYAFLYIASDPAAPSTCFIAGTVASRTAGVRIVFKTLSNGSMWASVLTVNDFQDIILGEPLGETAPLPLDQLIPEGRQQESDVIDMLVVGTREAVCGQNNQDPDCTITEETLIPLRNQITFLMFQLNQILRNSQIDLVVRRVGPITFDQGDFSENGGSYLGDRVLNDINRCDFGNICELRQQNCADLVHLLPFNDDFDGNIGLASDIGPNPDAFSCLTALDDVPTSFAVFTHEVGHMTVRTRCTC